MSCPIQTEQGEVVNLGHPTLGQTQSALKARLDSRNSECPSAGLAVIE